MPATTAKYFDGDDELFHPYCIKNDEYSRLFPGVKGRRWDSFSMWVAKNAAGELRPVTRWVHYKNRPSLHKCDARCMSAKGHNCECACGGKNHGLAA